MDIRESVIEILNSIRPMEWEDVENIIEDGGFESLEMFMLISKISVMFDVELDMSEIDLEVFSTVDSIVEMLEELVG